MKKKRYNVLLRTHVISLYIYRLSEVSAESSTLWRVVCKPHICMLPFIGQRLRRYREGEAPAHVFHTRVARAREADDSLLTRRIRGLQVALHIDEAEHGHEGEITNLLRNNTNWDVHQTRRITSGRILLADHPYLLSIFRYPALL